VAVVSDRVFLDTNVYIDWADSDALPLKGLLRAEGIEPFLSPSVVLEALEDYWESSEKRFDRAKVVLQYVLADMGRLLPPEGATLRGAVDLDPSYSGPLRAEYLTQVIDFCLSLSRSERDAEIADQKRFGLATLQSEFREYREQYIGGRDRLRAEILAGLDAKPEAKMPSAALKEIRIFLGSPAWRRVYVSNLLRGVTEQVTDELVAKCTLKVAARLAFDTVVVDLMFAPGYNLNKHRGDCFDSGLLTHLADSRLSLVTSDKRLVDRTAGSSQSDRILFVGDLV
jgi:hypothetical protein